MKMIETLKKMWAYSPKETAAIVTIAAVCSVMMAVLLAAAMLPTEPDEFEEVREC